MQGFTLSGEVRSVGSREGDRDPFATVVWLGGRAQVAVHRAYKSGDKFACAVEVVAGKNGGYFCREIV